VDNNESHVLDKDDAIFMFVGENSHEDNSGFYF